MVDDKMDTIEMTKWIQNKEIYKEIYKEIFSRQSFKKLFGYFRRKYGRTYKRNTIKICYAEEGVLHHTQGYYRNRSVRWSANAEVKKTSCK